MSETLLLIILGIVAGILSGLIGIGGGTIVIPFLIYVLGFSQHLAQGTTLALMVPPIGLLAAWKYYQNGFVDLKVAGLICLGFFAGGLLGAQFAPSLPGYVLKKIFGVFLLYVSIMMIFGK